MTSLVGAPENEIVTHFHEIDPHFHEIVSKLSLIFLKLSLLVYYKRQVYAGNLPRRLRFNFRLPGLGCNECNSMLHNDPILYLYPYHCKAERKKSINL